jgi:cell division control protein 6
MFKQSSIFKRDGIRKLDFEYVPSRLPHREEYLEKLVKFFRIAIDQPGMLSERILITGGSGTGKTATAKKVGAALERIAKNRGLDLIYAHVNCRTTSGKFGLVQSIIRQAAPSLPLRGYGPIELLHALWDYLNEHNKFLVLTLDEIDYYLRTTGEDIIYELTRLTDAVTNVPQRINFMFIARNHSFMKVMSSETLSRFRPQDRLEFPPYLEGQLKDILKERVKEAFRESVVPEDIIEFVSRNTAKYGNGDARYAILLLLSAGMIADRDMNPTVLPEHVREAQEKTDPKISDEDVTMLPKDEKYVLLALARCLKSEKAAIDVSLEEVESSYHIVCEEYRAEPVGRVLLHALVKDLKAAGVITLNEKFELGLNGVKAEILEKFLMDLLKRKESDA